ncbi:DUF6520 family protein [Psychroflexus halocasei]|uniref:Secreted protein n=1 Tax=Psychroflexus halocasei TaxID=908615 RepID=A0A1H4C200_9FLAO|nr:DUF6520 family protein [Psychroflexus halocasei]SEA54347.1 hypothetical protein SAMN05421540_10711 [Psychroflexus halocasei]
MKRLLKVVPLMALVLTVGFAFANKEHAQSAGWVELNGTAQQLQSKPCVSPTNDLCKVIFASDPNSQEHQVYMDENLSIPMRNGSTEAYIIND